VGAGDRGGGGGGGTVWPSTRPSATAPSLGSDSCRAVKYLMTMRLPSLLPMERRVAPLGAARGWEEMAVPQSG
jgi:hypothetical protein